MINRWPAWSRWRSYAWRCPVPTGEPVIARGQASVPEVPTQAAVDEAVEAIRLVCPCGPMSYAECHAYGVPSRNGHCLYWWEARRDR